MPAFATGIAIYMAVMSVIKSVGNMTSLGIYAKQAIPFITSIPEYLGNFITAIGNFLPPYVVAPFLAMLGLLVSYLICHLFAQFIDSIPS